MSQEKKPYRTTALAGFFVAGVRVPTRQDTETSSLVPVVGAVIHLTDAEAKYELLNGAIEAAEEPPQSPPRRSPRAA